MKKILYFISGPMPTAAQGEEAAALGAFFRNAAVADKTGFVESCDAVAGDVPERYKHFPLVGKVEREEQAPPPLPDVIIPDQPSVIVEPEAVPDVVSHDQDGGPMTISQIEEYRRALMGKTVKEQREIAKENGIPLPADINTKEEIADYVSVRLAQS